jgi:hypothetical protein
LANALYASGSFSNGTISLDGSRYVARFKIPNTVFDIQKPGQGIVKVYPNPSNDKITVMLKSDAKSFHYQILNSIGVVVFAGASLSSNVAIDISGLQSGVYTLRIEGFEESFLFEKK